MEWSDVESSLLSTLSKEELEDIDRLTDLVSSVINQRVRLKLTQQELADRAGLKQSAVARFEKLGAVPRIDTLCRLAKVLGLQVKLEPIPF
jgi:predicted transcriptional regulator